MSFLFYIGKVFLCSLTLFGYYQLFLKNRSHHKFNRLFLLGIVIFSLFVPMLSIPVSVGEVSTEPTVLRTIKMVTFQEFEHESQLEAAKNSTVTLELICKIIYGLGAVMLLIIFIRSLISIRKIKRSYREMRIEGMSFYDTSEPGTPFSFFNNIFWNNRLKIDTARGQQIFRHELSHVKQRHSFDILLLEIVSILFWINPVFFFVKNELKAVHEFLADEEARQDSNPEAYAELMITEMLAIKRSIPVNYFFQNHIRRRISMLTKKDEKKSYWRMMLVLPLMLCIAAFASVYASSSNKINSSKKNITVVIDAGHGGEDPGAKNADGSLQEKDITLQLSKKVSDLSAKYNVNVVLTRDQDLLPGKSANITAGLNYRQQTAVDTKADCFVSIHVASAETENNNGIKVFVSSRNLQFDTQSRSLGSLMLNKLGEIYSTRDAVLSRSNSGIFVLDKAPCPAVIVECGFISNKHDSEFIRSEENQTKIAQKILEALSSYGNLQ